MVTARSAAWEADVCIVGAGPVGLTLATNLLSRGVSVVVLEGGGADAVLDDAASDDALLGPIDAPGWKPLWTSRARGVGGTSRIWNTVVGGERVAKYALLDALDFEPRPGVPHTGWPLGADELAPFVVRASQTCGLAFDLWRVRAEDRVGSLPRRPYAFGPRSRFTDALAGAVDEDPRGRLLRDATAVGFELSEGGRRVEAVRWVGGPTRSPRGAPSEGEAPHAGAASGGTVHAGSVVLAGGALENARILMSAAPDGTTPWGNTFWLGRGLMEHPVDRSLELVTRSPLLCPDPGRFGPHLDPGARESGWKWTMDRLTLDPVRLRDDVLPNASLRFTTQEASPAVLDAPVARSWARRLVPGSRTRRMVGDVVRAAARELRRFRGLRYRLRVDLEQWPDPENRVLLTNELDGHGRARLHVRWRWSDEDEGRRRRIVEAFARGLEEAGLGRLERHMDETLDPNAHHHAGTTRMAADPGDGVVDPDLRVHGSHNLYVCGSSVFPTAGAVNPTLTAVALAHRLADHLTVGLPRHPSCRNI